MRILALTLLARALLGAALCENPTQLTEGKIKTDRTIELETTVEASPAEVYHLWTSVDGVKKFFAPDARIDARPGGRYQIIFFPSKDPEGNSHGTKGARVLRAVPDKEFAFEWITFAGDDLLGNHAPPYAPPAQRNVAPLATWVELSFEPLDGQPNRTHLKFAHYGFREGALWGESYQWFGRAWKGVLDQLADYCQNRKRQQEEARPGRPQA
jgi:uncharacterized protein YndB with AHSA1/START domain